MNRREKRRKEKIKGVRKRRDLRKIGEKEKENM